jgi:hypothetical protein
MITPISSELALHTISPVLKGELEQILQTHIQPKEGIYAVADCSVEKFFGLFVVTDYRVIFSGFRADRVRKGIRYYKKGGGFFDKTVPVERYWFLDYVSPMTKKEINDRFYRDGLLSEIISVQQQRYSITVDTRTIEILQLGFKERNRDIFGQMPTTAFDLNMGQRIYNLIQNGIRNNGKILQE